MSALTVTHDNGNHVCLSDGSVYVRQDEELHMPDGSTLPLPRRQAEAIIAMIGWQTITV